MSDASQRTREGPGQFRNGVPLPTLLEELGVRGPGSRVATGRATRRQAPTLWTRTIAGSIATFGVDEGVADPNARDPYYDDRVRVAWPHVGPKLSADSATRSSFVGANVIPQ